MTTTVWCQRLIMVATVWLAVGAAPTRAADATGPPGVVVLQPGVLGFKHLSLLGDYWGDVPTRLRARGYVVVERAPAPVSSSSLRGRELADDIAALTVLHGVDRVVVIAHSQGGVDVRAALAEVPWLREKIGAVATVASPHAGSVMIDVGTALPAPLVDGVMDALHRSFEANQDLTPRPSSTRGVLEELSAAGTADLTRRQPESPVPFFSVGGVTGQDVDGACAGGRWSAPDVEDVAAPTAWWNLAAQFAIAGVHSTDGVVPTKSMRFGTFLGCAPADHGDWLGWVSHPLEEELVWSPTPFLLALADALVDVDRHGHRAMETHVPTLARLARARPTA